VIGDSDENWKSGAIAGGVPVRAHFTAASVAALNT
jgi:hypothetical protein